MLVMLSGMVMLVKLVQLEKASTRCVTGRFSIFDGISKDCTDLGQDIIDI